MKKLTVLLALVLSVLLPALAVAEETARLHKGGLAVCSGTVGLSLSTSLPGDAGLYVAPTPTQLLRDTLSAVQVGLYSSLG